MRCISIWVSADRTGCTHTTVVVGKITSGRAPLKDTGSTVRDSCSIFPLCFGRQPGVNKCSEGLRIGLTDVIDGVIVKVRGIVAAGRRRAHTRCDTRPILSDCDFRPHHFKVRYSYCVNRLLPG